MYSRSGGAGISAASRRGVMSSDRTPGPCSSTAQQIVPRFLVLLLKCCHEIGDRLLSSD